MTAELAAKEHKKHKEYGERQVALILNRFYVLCVLSWPNLFSDEFRFVLS